MIPHLFRNTRMLFSSPRYHQYLSDHLIKMIQTHPHYQKCVPTLEKFIEENQGCSHSQIKIKLNMLLNIHSLPEPLRKFQCELSGMVGRGELNHQSELDRLTDWLQKKIKFNRDVRIADFRQDQQDCDRQKEQLLWELEQLKQKSESFDIAGISKRMRQKYFAIDSRDIYNACKQIAEHKKSSYSKTAKCSNQFWDKLGTIRPRLVGDECNDPQITQQHLKITGGKLRFRFPPEPNGYLHIGHVKAMRINFETAKRMGGTCYLRYDDTNPQTESHEYIDSIMNNIRWLGYEPDKITFASDYFPQMIQFAIKLVEEGKAYVCDSTQLEMEEERRKKTPNPYRSRPVEESLKMFPNLKEGQTLRLMLDPAAKNPTLRDPVIYRVKEQAHPRTGSKYRIYPIYDFAHCICDSLEHIDYSLCSLEFEVRRELYYKILHLLNIYKPIVWEYSRLNVEGSVISKRKIKSLLDNRIIEGWDDPRLLTIGGLINRGYTPSMLMGFIDRVNASRTGNQNMVRFSLLERQMRKQLLAASKKTMMVLNPKKAVIKNHCPFQIKLEGGQLFLTQSIFIEQEEAMEVKDIIILKYAGPFEVQSASEAEVQLYKLQETVTDLKENKIKYKVIHWVSEKDVEQRETIIFNKLLDDTGEPLPDSKVIFPKALIPKHVLEQKETNQYWQMERLGYFKFIPSGQFIRCVAL